ncbi:MAG: hypothetical protein JRH13_14640 [Deltaproteobacteria bacterium]|nr:hypothetical protein [Deltaproteobacteria bacterium]MBW2017953.1 hypothetical protein [Deltaproteobacteria bacterium]MBW2130587.1 hypothetical protein [Deltaproteobacteria bacterium]MBW2302956.1 hypothetical protein [Deltaproteobacteria bacterium]
MHLYWRVIEELKYLGETWTFTNPSFKRCYQRWLTKNAGAVTLCALSGINPGRGHVSFKWKRPSLN